MACAAWPAPRGLPLAISRWRKAGTRLVAHRRAYSGQAEPELSADTVVVQAMRHLPEKPREVLALHYLADLPVEEVARELGRPVSTVKTQLRRGSERLCEILAPPLAPHPPGP